MANTGTTATEPSHRAENTPEFLRTMMKFPRILWDAYWRFVDDDGWAIASHIALSALMSLFPFLIFVTALAGSSARRTSPTRRPTSSSTPGRSRCPDRSRVRSTAC